MSTSLSRHFFRLDEVAASLRYALIERRIEEGMYWTEELIDSEEYGLLLKIIIDVWVFTIGPLGRLSLLPTISQAVEAPGPAVLRLLSFSILRCPKSIADGSVLAIAVLALEDLKDVANCLEMQMEKMNLNGKTKGPDACVTTALERRDLRTAVKYIFRGGAVSGLILERREYIVAIRKLLAAAKAVNSRIWVVIWSIIDAIILTMTVKEFAAATAGAALTAQLSAGMEEMLAEWQQAVGKRGRRRFKVQTVAIKWLTARGRMSYKESTESELMRGDVWRLLEGCRYWDRKAAEFGLTDGLSAAAKAMDEETEEALEGFINFAFPDDIPDEWSVADRQLSHGDGFLVPGTAPSRANWLRSWLPPAAQLVGPKEFAIARQAIESSSVGGYYTDDWLAVALSQFSITL